MSTQIYPLLPPEVEIARKRATGRYKENLGPRPSRKDVQNTVLLDAKLTPIHYVGFLIAFIFALVTASKVFEQVALDLSRHYDAWHTALLLVNQQLDGIIASRGIIITLNQLAYATATELSIILFTIWFRITERRARNNWYDVLWYFQYIPLLIVAATTAYLVQVNFAGSDNPLRSAIVVLVTLGVAVVFEEALMIYIRKGEEINKILRPLQQTWDYRIKNAENDAKFLEFLFEELQGVLINIVRKVDGKQVRPNEWLKEAEQVVLLAAVQEQMNRMNAIRLASRREAARLGGDFEAPRRAQVVDAAGNIATLPQHDDYGNGDIPPTTGRAPRIAPPNGKWTATELVSHLVRNNQTNFTIQQAQQVYSHISRPLWNEVKSKIERRK